MEDDRIPRKAYKMLCYLDEKGKKNWVTKVRECLYRFGFGIVWKNQGVGRENVFVQVFKQRLVDCRWQNVHEHLNESERFEMYSQFISDNQHIPLYLELDMNQHLKFVMTKFRFGVSDINVHSLRYRNVDGMNKICPMCKVGEENEKHFVLCCPFLAELRECLIPRKFYRTPSNCHFAFLMASRNAKIITNLSIYLYKAFKIREIVVGC
jgi:hypothetical protein